MKIDKEDKTLILLSSLPQSYDHIVASMIYGKKTRILEKITPTLLSNEIRKTPNQNKQGGSGLVTGSKGRGGKEGSGSSKACHFYHKEGHWKNDCKCQ